MKATTDDMEQSETAVLRRANDAYRKIIYNAQVYANTGAGTYEKAVDMATKDFLAAGIQCVEYSNGARHTLSDIAQGLYHPPPLQRQPRHLVFGAAPGRHALHQREGRRAGGIKMLLAWKQMDAIGKYNTGAPMTDEERKTALNAEAVSWEFYGKHLLKNVEQEESQKEKNQ